MSDSEGESGGKQDQQYYEQANYLVNYSKHLERRLRALETEKQLLDAERMRLERELQVIRSELEKLRTPPLLAGYVIEVLTDGRAIVKSSTGPQFVVQVARSLTDKISSGSKVALNQRNFALVELLPASEDPAVRAMEVEERPSVSYSDVGGLEEQIRELKEAVELPLLRPELFEQVGIEPPKGVLLYGAPGTGKTLLARAVAHETKATFVRVVGSELVRKYIGEGARLVREIFEYARKKKPTILFIDELDAIGSKRIDLATSGDREVQRTLMQLLSEMDGFNPRGDVKLAGATNRPDILDPALLRPGRFDRFIEISMPDEKARFEIFKIHARKINKKDVDFNKLTKITLDTTGADIRSICVEAGMFAIRKEKEYVTQEDFIKAVQKVMTQKAKAGSEPTHYV